MVRLILFDIDGTLIRTGGAGVKAFERTFATEFKVPHATREVSFAGRTDVSLVRQLFLAHGIPASPENFNRFFESYVFWLHELLVNLKGEVCPGIHEFIAGFDRLPNPPMLGLLTGNVRLGAEIKLRHYGLWDHFRSGAFGDDHEHRNELAAIAHRRGCDLLGKKLKGSEVVVIGDTPLDIECAMAIKAKCLAVCTGGHTREQLEAHRPTWVVENLTGRTPDEFCC